MEEIRRRIYLIHILPLTLLYDRRQLLGIPYHQELHTSERPVIMTITSQSHVYRIKQISPHHGYLIDDQKIQGTDYLLSLLAETSVTFRSLIFRNKFLDIRKIRTQRQLKKGMNGAAARIDCRNTSRSENDKTLPGCPGYVPQKRGLSGTGLASKKDRAACVIHIALGHFKYFIFLYFHYLLKRVLRALSAS